MGARTIRTRALIAAASIVAIASVAAPGLGGDQPAGGRRELRAATDPELRKLPPPKPDLPPDPAPEPDVYRHGPWRLELWNVDDMAHVRLFHAGSLRWMFAGEASFRFFVLSADQLGAGSARKQPRWICNRDDRPPLPVEDVTGEGGMTLVLHEWTGGVHASFNYSILRLREDGEVDALRELRLRNGHLSLSDLDADGVAELIVEDDVLVELSPYYAATPFGIVVLRWNGERYECANDRLGVLGREPAAEHLVARVTTLAWGGCIEEAMALLGAAGDAAPERLWGFDSARSFWKAYRAQIRRSRFWNDLVSCFPALRDLPDLP